MTSSQILLVCSVRNALRAAGRRKSGQASEHRRREQAIARHVPPGGRPGEAARRAASGKHVRQWRAAGSSTRACASTTKPALCMEERAVDFCGEIRRRKRRLLCEITTQRIRLFSRGILPTSSMVRARPRRKVGHRRNSSIEAARLTEPAWRSRDSRETRARAFRSARHRCSRPDVPGCLMTSCACSEYPRISLAKRSPSRLT